MSMPVSEKSFLEKVAALIPGISGYREREGRRESDRRLREFLAGRLEEGRRSVDALRNAATKAGAMEALGAAGRLDAGLQKCVASLRYADYGYSGLFDQVKIREAELDRIYAFDEALVGEVTAIAEAVSAAVKEGWGGSVESLAERVETLDRTIGRRKELFDTPSV